MNPTPHSNAQRRFWLFLWLLPSLLIAQPFSLLASEAYNNPFIVERNVLASSIEKPYLNSRDAGATDAPKKLTFSCVVMGDSGMPIEGLSAGHFRLSMRPHHPNKPPTPLKTTFYEAGAKYWFDLHLPVVERDGFYDLVVRLATGQKKKPMLELVVGRAFRYRNRRVNLLFLVDNSASMLESDPKNNRFRAIMDLVGNPTFSKHLGKVAIVSFSDFASIHLPFTEATNKQAIERSLNKIRLGKKTHIPDAFKKSVALFARTPFEGALEGKKAVIFLTDGVSTYPFNDEHKPLLKRGVVVHTVGYANEHAYDEAFLRRLSKEGKGLFLRADENIVGRVYRSLLLKTQRTSEEIVLYPLHSSYSPYELIVVHYKSSVLGRLRVSLEKVRYNGKIGRAGSVRQPLKILRQRSNDVSLHASLEGTYSFELLFWLVANQQKSLRKRHQFQVRVGGAKKPFELPKSLHFDGVDMTGDTRIFGVTNKQQQPLLLRFEYFGATGPTQPKDVVQFDHPLLFLMPAEQSHKMVLFRTKHLVRRVVDDYLLVHASERTYLHNFSFVVDEAPQSQGVRPPTPRTTSFSAWIVGCFLSGFLGLLTLFAWRFLRRNHKNRQEQPFDSISSQKKQIKL